MGRMKLSARDWEVLQQALDNPPPPTEALRKLMRGARELWDETVRDPIPEEWLELLGNLK